MKKQQIPTLSSTFALAVGAALQRAGAGDRMAVALSGGLDSSALLHLAQAYVQRTSSAATTTTTTTHTTFTATVAT
ncbi:MAG: asparagine synthase-related protein, partial [Sphingomonadaceae bacterium]